MSRPWFPFYVGDYTRDTARLTTEAHGAYLLLMLDYWVNGAPPDDDETLSTITKLPLTTWKKRRPVLAKFFRVEGGVWFHGRIEKEREKAATVGASNSDKAREAAERRWAQERERKLAEHQASFGDAPSMGIDAPSIDRALPHDAQSQSPSPSSANSLKTRVFFDDFWKAYPRRDSDEAQERAEQAFGALLASGADPKVITFGAMAYCAKVRKQNTYATRYVKQAWRWLGEQDFAGAIPAEMAADKPFEPAGQDWHSAVKRWLLNESNWPRWAGNAPGTPSCRCPPEVLAELGVCPNTGRRVDASWWFAEIDTHELAANVSFAAEHRLKIKLYTFMVDGVEKTGAHFVRRFPPGYDEATGEKLAPSSAEENAA